jgi:maltose phosphorylase
MRYLEKDDWQIIEKGFDPEKQEASESLFSLGNGLMGQRANFEEHYSGPSLQGSYIAGVYYPDKTRVGWWKNGYPEYFAKVLNAPNWIGLDVLVKGEKLDLFTAHTESFERVLDMKTGLLSRTFTATLPNQCTVKVTSRRFLSMTRPETGVIEYTLTPVNFSGPVTLTPYIDGDVRNKDANYDEQFWNILHTSSNHTEGSLLAQTKKLDFKVAFAMKVSVEGDFSATKHHHTDLSCNNTFSFKATEGQPISVTKFVGLCSSLNHSHNQLIKNVQHDGSSSAEAGFTQLLLEQKQHWAEIWQQSDIQIKGDTAAQQGIRFNIFQLNQTYTGKDVRLNIGPKGFTGEKYGGSTYWDTEAYCIPFFLSTAPPEVTRNLLLYRYKQLPKAIDNAGKMGFTNGAALYPMVTMNGEECHNEWEITFEEIHRNGAIAFAIHNYLRHTGDLEYLAGYGLEVLIGIARFWSQRATFSHKTKQFVILGVTGPNEYENNINNNWYTNKIAVWCLKYTIECFKEIEHSNRQQLENVIKKCQLQPKVELPLWESIANNMRLPYDENEDIFLQQDQYMDKEQILVKELDPAIRPINQHWSWDRILRSCFIKQADVMQGIYLFDEEFDTETIRRNFNFYESRTVHESSLSPCVHSILAARIGDIKKAYQLYLRTSRLDLDDYNLEVHEGLHITSMAGTWMSIVEGLGGKRVFKDGQLRLAPIIPNQWDSYSFRILFKGVSLKINVTREEVTITPHNNQEIAIIVYDKEYTLKGSSSLILPLKTINHEE